MPRRALPPELFGERIAVADAKSPEAVRLSGKKGRKAKARSRPGQVDPDAQPRVGSSPHPGLPYPLGATPYAHGTNFAVVADGLPGVSDVQLCLVDPVEPGDHGADGAAWRERRLSMDEKTYGVWHTFVPNVGVGQRYGFRVPARDPSKILLDPYARRLTRTDYDLVAAASYGMDTLGRAPLGIVTDAVASTSVRPFVPWEQTVVYEAHVVGLTRLHPEVPEALRGTFLGVAHPAVIAHLKSLRVTTLELLPVQAAAAEPGLVATGRRNYWGYSTLGFFSPQPGYASEPGREIDEFVEMVDTLHANGIEVVLDVVYNHTCEGGPGLTADLCWRGLSPASYYLPDGQDITGTGNTLNPGTLPVIRMVTDSMRYWAGHLGVDGFRLDLASVHGRPDGRAFDPASALLSAIAADPLLATRKLIAEPWDATGEGYAVGAFGPNWTEWNDRFRDTTRDFWRGLESVRDLAYRLTGSSDLFAPARRPWASINFVTAHDGFTLRDLVSYDHKHNRANGEDNRDGTSHNRSWNYGTEGETTDPAILALRTRQARNLAATMLLATGTPMVTMGDELWRTQLGNNNAYCQDNEISWVNWDPVFSDGTDGGGDAARDMLQFFRRTLAVRAGAPALRQGEFFDGRAPGGGDGIADLVWFNPNGTQMADNDWFDGARRTLIMWIDGRDVRGHGSGGEPVSDDSWLILLHADGGPVLVTLPDGPHGSAYQPVLDTSTPTGEPADTAPHAAGSAVLVPGRTVWLLRAERG